MNRLRNFLFATTLLGAASLCSGGIGSAERCSAGSSAGSECGSANGDTTLASCLSVGAPASACLGTASADALEGGGVQSSSGKERGRRRGDPISAKVILAANRAPDTRESSGDGTCVREECVTQGSGGPTEDLSAQWFSASNGRDSNYHLYAAGLDWSKPVGLGVLLHGDIINGDDFYYDPSWGAEGMTEILRAHNMLTINVLSPHWSGSWWKSRQGSANAVFLAELIENEIFERYPINREKILIIGFSGGADFAARWFIPEQAEEIICRGGALLFGGGSPPWGSRHRFSRDFKSNFRLHFYTGQDDTRTMTWVRDGVDWYIDRGLAVTTEFPRGIHHTNIPFEKVLTRRIGSLLP